MCVCCSLDRGEPVGGNQVISDCLSGVYTRAAPASARASCSPLHRFRRSSPSRSIPSRMYVCVPRVPMRALQPPSSPPYPARVPRCGRQSMPPKKREERKYSGVGMYVCALLRRQSDRFYCLHGDAVDRCRPALAGGKAHDNPSYSSASCDFHNLNDD